MDVKSFNFPEVINIPMQSAVIGLQNTMKVIQDSGAKNE